MPSRGATPLVTGVQVLGALQALPGGSEVLALGQGPGDLVLIGGAVRDLLLGHRPRELDVVVAGEAAKLAGELATRIQGASPRVTLHERFGTALVEWDGARVDIAERRAESYPVPGALPEVRPGSLEEDLRRRDFTVNAIAVPLGGPELGELLYEGSALDDLAEGQLRVLHERSFIDDPTRLLRLARYSARLGFQVEPFTDELAAAAVAVDALARVSFGRVGAELRLALAEPDPLAALAELERLGLLAALHPRLRFEAPPVRRALELLAAGGPRAGGAEVGRPDLLLLSALALPLALRADGDCRAEVAALLDRLEFPAAERDRVASAAVAVARLAEDLPRAGRPSELRAVALSVPPEGVALAGGVSAPAAPAARRWLEEVRHVRLAITGEDLLAAGVPQGPEIGRRLEETLRMRLDGELPDEREAQLRATLRPR